MKDIIAVLSLSGLIGIGAIIIRFRYVTAKSRVEKDSREKDIDRMDRPDLIQVDSIHKER